MRIVLLIVSGLERPAGHRYFQIARELVRLGHSVRLLALHPDLPACPERRFRRDGVEVWYVGQMHARKSSSNPSRFGPLELLGVLIRSTLGMVWGVACSPADAYHLGKPQPINGLAALLGVALGRRQRFYVDCDDDEVLSNRLSAGWQRAVFAFWQWLLPGLAAGATINTEFMRQRLARRGIGPLAYVPNGVDLARFRPPAAPVLAALRAALGLEGRRAVAYVGTLALQNHPVDLLLEAFALLAERRPDVDLLLVGGGEDLGELRRRAAAAGLARRVLFAGQIPQASVPAYLALASLSVDPVNDDDVARARWPLKVAESLALGVPIVTGDVGDRAAAVGDGGLVVEPGSPAALAAAIGELLDDEPRRRRMALAASAQAGRFAWAKLARSWFELYALGAA